MLTMNRLILLLALQHTSQIVEIISGRITQIHLTNIIFFHSIIVHMFTWIYIKCEYKFYYIIFRKYNNILENLNEMFSRYYMQKGACVNLL